MQLSLNELANILINHFESDNLKSIYLLQTELLSTSIIHELEKVFDHISFESSDFKNNYLVLNDLSQKSLNKIELYYQTWQHKKFIILCSDDDKNINSNLLSDSLEKGIYVFLITSLNLTLGHKLQIKMHSKKPTVEVNQILAWSNLRLLNEIGIKDLIQYLLKSILEILKKVLCEESNQDKLIDFYFYLSKYEDQITNLHLDHNTAIDLIRSRYFSLFKK